MPVPLRAKSHFSLGLGTASVEALVERAAAAGLRALALTDLENLYGQARFHHLCGERGLRPVTGVELRPGFDGRREQGRRDGRLVLLAPADAGYANLCRIVSRRRAQREHLGEDPVESLRGHAEGLFVLTDHAPTYRRVLDEGVAEVAMTRPLLVRPGEGASPAPEIVRLAEERGVSPVADVDAVMLDPGDHDLHVLLAAIHRGTSATWIRTSGMAESSERSLGDPTRAAALFADRPAALEEAARLAESCTLDLRRRDRVLPPVSPERSADDELARLCAEALRAGRRRSAFIGPAYAERLAAELRVIAELGFAPYVLAVAEIVAAAAERRIRTAGRGSAAGSLVCHVLGITAVDPVAHGLYFERFLHPRRGDAPDIDVDVDSRRRDELIEWVRRRYGRTQVAMVAAFQTFRWRSAVREGLKGLGVSADAVTQIMRRLPRDVPGAGQTAEDEVGPGEAILKDALPLELHAALPLLRALEGTPRHVSVHPGGVVIAPDDLAARVPLERAPGGLVTQYDLRSVESAGLLKIDLLGNHALAEMDETIPDPGAIPLDDAATFAALARAETLNCFQVESPAIRSVLRSVPVRTLDDLTAVLAVVRPGAAAGQAKRAYVRRARGLEAAELLHPALQERLAATHGVLLYEEDIIFMLHVLGGITVAEADELRAAIVAHGGDPPSLARLGERFVARAYANGRDPEAAHAAWHAAERFAAYSFSKAHAASYALLAYRSVFLRTHFPVELACSVLDNHAGMYPPRTIAAEIVRWGVRLRGPSATRSEIRTVVEASPPHAPAVRLGLGAVKRLRRSTSRAIVEARTPARPFNDLADLLDRVPLTRGEVRALVLSGACDELPPLSADGYPLAHQALLEGIEGKRSPKEFAEILARARRLPADGPQADRVRKWRRLVRIRNELEHFDMHPSGHPLAVLRTDAEAVGCVTSAEIETRVGDVVHVAAVLAASRRVRTRQGDVMQFLTLEDERGTVEAVLFPAAYRHLGSAITTPGPYLVTARVAEEEDDVHLVVTDLRPFHQRPREPGAG
jgi:DNA-directed DNA polymerase III PolC